MNEPCRLCGSKATETFAEANKRHYLRCETCLLVFVIQDELPDLEVERAEYGLHHNDPADQGYRTHLSKLTRPLVTGIPVPAHGLDFGCGPGPTISVMLAEQGFDMADYDPAFFPDEALLQKQYDFVSCTEVVEHFYNPGRDFELLARLLKPGGRFGIMTQLLSDDIDFEHWYYAREISHVAFYSKQTMQWIGQQLCWQVKIIGRDVVIFQ